MKRLKRTKNRNCGICSYNPDHTHSQSVKKILKQEALKTAGRANDGKLCQLGHPMTAGIPCDNFKEHRYNWDGGL